MKVREVKELVIEFTEEEIEKYFIDGKLIGDFSKKIQVYNIIEVLNYEKLENNKYVILCIIKL